MDAFIEDLHKEGISTQDLRNFLRKFILSTQALDMLLIRDIKVSDIEMDLEKLKKGNLRIVREINLIVVDKKDAQRLLQLIEKEKDIGKIAQTLGVNLEHLDVEKGTLIEALDKEVWKAGEGDLVFAEDDSNIYVAQVIKQKEVVEGVDVELLREELIQKKLESAKKDLLEKLRKRSFIRIIG